MAKSKITVELTLKDGSKLVLDKTKIKNIESLSQTNADASTIFYGVLASSGRLEILDYDGTIKRYIQQGIIDTSSIKVDIYINGVLSQSHTSSDSNYANESSIMTIELTNKLSLWDTINYGGYYYPEKPETAYEMLKNILVSVGYKEDYIDDIMLSDNIFAEDNTEKSIRDYLDSIKIEYPYLPSDTLRATIDKFCTLAQLNAVLDNNGDIKFVSARPLIQNTKNVIQIPLSKQYGDFTYSVILRNKYDAVEIDKYDTKSQIKYNEIVSSLYNDIPISYQEDKDDTDTVVSWYNATTDYVLISYAYIKTKYFSTKNTIPQFSDYNLNKIINIYTGLNSDNENNIKVNVEYTLKSSTTSEGNYIVTSYSDPPSTIGNGSVNGYVVESDIVDNFTEEQDLHGYIDRDANIVVENKITKEVITPAFIGIVTATASLNNKDNISTAEYTRDNYGNYNFEITTLVGEKVHKLGGFTTNSNTSVEKFTLNGTTQEIIPKSVEISFYGDIREITFNETSASSQNINSATNPVSIETSELFSDKTKINGIEITDIVKQNILNDYSEGISSGKLTVAATDYFDKDGNKMVDIYKGQTIKVGDVVNIEGDDRYWRVTGVNERKTGTPYIDLEVMEVKLRYFHFIEIDLSVHSNFNGAIEFDILDSSNLIVDWGDGSVSKYLNNTTNISHTYSDISFKGVISIKGDFNGFILGETDSRYIITKIIIPANVTSIAYGAFQGCSRLMNISLPDTIKSIGSYAFQGCRYLINIIIPSNITKIEDGTFNYCINLRDIIIPNNVTSIGYGAFSLCESLKNITIPPNVKTIGEIAFQSCTNLTEMTVLAMTPPVLSNYNAISTATTTIYIPIGTLNAYRSATNWSLFADKFVEI